MGDDECLRATVETAADLYDAARPEYPPALFDALVEPTGIAADSTPEIETSGLFADVRVRRFVWERLCAADEYVSLLDTLSGHIAMEPVKREWLCGEIRRRIESRRQRTVRRHWYAILHVARRVDSPR